eukprot:31198-Pelagococcus_subviridis.AAC.22
MNERFDSILTRAFVRTTHPANDLLTTASHPQDLQALAKRDRYPVRLRRTPPQLGYLRARAVRENRIQPAVVRRRHRAQVPYQRLRVVPRGAYVRRRVRRPRDDVHRRLVPGQLRDGHRGVPNVQDDHLAVVHLHRRHVPRVLLVPRESEQRRVRLRGLVYDRAVVFIPQVEHSNAAVRGDAREHLRSPPRDVVHLLVVRDELRVHSLSLEIPYRARRVQRRRPDPLELLLVPVERRQRRAKLGLFAVVQEASHRDAVVRDVPHPEVVTARRDEILFAAFYVGDERELRARVRVRERVRRRGRERASLFV